MKKSADALGDVVVIGAYPDAREIASAVSCGEELLADARPAFEHGDPSGGSRHNGKRQRRRAASDDYDILSFRSGVSDKTEKDRSPRASVALSYLSCSLMVK